MSVDWIACPYCNARVAAADVQVRHGKRHCPRCGEPIPGSSTDSTVAISSRPLLTTGATNGAERPHARISSVFLTRLGVLWSVVLVVSLWMRFSFPPESRIFKTAPFMILLGGIGLMASLWLWFFRLPRSNQATVKFLFGNMALMLGIGVSYALVTMPQRRQNDPRDLPPSAVSPGQLAALGYLPADAVLIAGIHVNELREEPAGKAFLDKPQWDAVQLALKYVKNWTGLDSEAIDHVALAVRESSDVPLVKLLNLIDKGGIPCSLTVVVHTRRPYRPDSPPDALRKLPSSQLHGKPLYLVEPMGFQAFAKGLVWCAAEKTLVLALWWDGSSLDAMTKLMPERPRAGVWGLSRPLASAVEEKLTGTPVWVAGHGASPRTFEALLPLPRITNELKQDLRNVPTFTMGLRFDKVDVTLQADLHCVNEHTARRVAKQIENQSLPVIGPAKVVSTVPEDRQLAVRAVVTIAYGPQPLSAAINVARDAAEPHWVTFQLRSDAETLFAALQKSKGLFGFLPRAR